MAMGIPTYFDYDLWALYSLTAGDIRILRIETRTLRDKERQKEGKAQDDVEERER